MLKIKPELVTVTDDKKGKYQSWETSVCFDPVSGGGIFYCQGHGTLYLTGYGDCEEEARANLNLTFEKLIQAVVENEFILDNFLGKQQKAEVNLESLSTKITLKNQHEETDWGKAVGQEIWWSDEDDVIFI